MNVPSKIKSWESSFLFDLFTNIQIFTRETPMISEIRINEENAKVHAIVHDFPKDMSPLIRKFVAAAVIRFLELHGLGCGADVRFVGFASEELFTQKK